MQKTLEKAQAEISKETDANKAAKLEEKYREEINRQKLSMDENYNKRIADLNTKIHSVVADKAKNQNYNIIILFKESIIIIYINKYYYKNILLKIK